MTTELAFNLFFSFGSSAVYFLIGRGLGRRQLQAGPDHLAWQALRWVWFGQAARIFIAVASAVLVLIGITNLYVHITLGLLVLLGLAVTLWGLLSYIAYLYTGKVGWITGLAIFYGLYFVFLVYTALARQPTGVILTGGGSAVTYAQSAAPLVGLIYLAVLLLPQLVGSLFLFSLFFRVKEANQRYRILLVSGSIFIWFGLALASLFVPDLGQAAWWPLTNQLIGLATALIIYWAYFPPMLIQRRFNIAPIS